MAEMKRVLVVEDEEIIRNSLTRLLERHEYEVCEAATVTESVEKYNIDEFDVIISDLRLPGAPGTDLIKITNIIRELLKEYLDIKIFHCNKKQQ